MMILRRPDRIVHQNIDHRLLEGCRHVRFVHRYAAHPAFIQVIENGGFQAAETEVIRRFFDMRSRKFNGMGISLFCQPVDLRTARIAKADGTGNLVERLARRVVPGPSEDLKYPVVLDDNQMRMASGYDLA